MGLPGSVAAILFALLLAGPLAGCLTTPRSAGHEFLSASPYTKLHIEIDYVDGKAPRASAVDLLRQRVDERLNKPGGVTVDQTAFASTGSAYSADDLRELERQHRDREPAGDTMTLYLLYVNGRYEADENVLGVQYGRSSIAVFKDTVDTSAPLGLPFGRDDVEKAVVVHEFGHALGLVNNGIGMVRDHEDDEHPKHSTNKDSVMYYAVDTKVGIPLFDDGPPNQFDAEDIADMQKAGGK